MRPTILALHALRATCVVALSAAALLPAAEEWPDAGGAGREGGPVLPGGARRRAELTTITSVVVRRVWEGSRADRLGIKAGDLMVGPNINAQVTEFDFRTSRAFKIEDLPVDISVRRGDQIFPLRYLAEHPDAWGGTQDTAQLEADLAAQEAERASQLAELEAREANWRRQVLNGPDPVPSSPADPMAEDEAGTDPVVAAANEPIEVVKPTAAIPLPVTLPMPPPTTTADREEETSSSRWPVTPFAILGLLILVIAGLLGIRRRL